MSGGDVPEVSAAAANAARKSQLIGIEYARILAETDSLGEREAEAFQQLVDQHGKRIAMDVKCFATFVMWGTLGGNTINQIKRIVLGV